MIKAHLKILKKGVEAWNKWRKEHPNIKPDLSGVDVQNVGFSGGQFQDVNFSGAYLKRWAVENSRFSGAILRDATIESCTFNTCNFSKDDSRNAAILRGATIENCTFDICNFSNADLVESELNWSRFNDVHMCDTNLAGVSLRRISFEKAKFAFANLEKCVALVDNPSSAPARPSVTFVHCDLTSAFFCGGVLCDAGFCASVLDSVNFKGADLQRSEFHDIKAKSALFSNANLSKASFSGEKMLANADFSDANLTDTFLADAWLAGANLSGTQLIWTSFENTMLHRVNFDRTSFCFAKLNGATFSEARLSNAKGLHSCSGITTASWSDASLSKSQQAFIIAALRDSWEDSKKSR